MPLYFILLARLLPILVNKSLHLFTISDLSLTIESESLKYFGNDLLVLFLERISFIVFHVFYIKFKIIKTFIIVELFFFTKTCF